MISLVDLRKIISDVWLVGRQTKIWKLHFYIFRKSCFSTFKIFSIKSEKILQIILFLNSTQLFFESVRQLKQICFIFIALGIFWKILFQFFAYNQQNLTKFNFLSTSKMDSTKTYMASTCKKTSTKTTV